MNIPRSLLATTVATAFALSLGTGVALAQGPNSEECDNARKAVVKLETQLTNVAAEERVNELKARDEAREALRVAQVALDQAQEAGGENPTPAQREAIRLARQTRDAAKDLLDRRQRELDTDSNRLAGIRAQLTLALQDRDEECAEPTPTPAPTTTNPPPTTTVTVVPPPPADDDDNAPVPSGGVDTGDGSSL